MLLPEGAPQSAVDELNRAARPARAAPRPVRDLPPERVPRRLRPVLPVPGARPRRSSPSALPATDPARAGRHGAHGAVGVSLGIVAAVRRGTRYDYAGTVLAVLGQSLPNFWLGIMLILLFGVTLRWLPTSGFQSWQLPRPARASRWPPSRPRWWRASPARACWRSSGRDYIRTGRAKGLAERAVILRHALRNAAIPVLTVLGLQIGTLLGGAVITESVFAWPGMGKLVVDAIFFRDFPGGADRADLLGHHLRGHQPAGRPALHRARPAHPLLG